jgi:hypothetical protein
MPVMLRDSDGPVKRFGHLALRGRYAMFANRFQPFVAVPISMTNQLPPIEQIVQSSAGGEIKETLRNIDLGNAALIALPANRSVFHVSSDDHRSRLPKMPLQTVRLNEPAE